MVPSELLLHEGGSGPTLTGNRKCSLGTSFSGSVVDDVGAARQWLEGLQECTGKTGVIGFCATGSFAILLAAAGYGLSAVAANYGQVPNDIDAIPDGACPMVASYGVISRHIRHLDPLANCILIFVYLCSIDVTKPHV